MPKLEAKSQPNELVPYYSSDQVTLYLGDCSKILPTIQSASIDFIFTDPPYGHNNNNRDLIHRIECAMPVRRSKKSLLIGTNIAEAARPIANDGVESSDLVRGMFSQASRLLKPGACCCCCCCGGGGPDPQFARWSLWMDEAIGFKQMVVWDKGPMGMGWHYRRSYETVLVAEKPGAACRWYDTTSRVENIIRPGYLGVKKIIPDSTQHPTEKPVELSSFFLRLHTHREDLVLDPFVGSGSTVMSCLKYGRRVIGIDCDEAHLKMTIDRMKSYEGGGALMDMKKQLKKLGRYNGRTKS